MSDKIFMQRTLYVLLIALNFFIHATHTAYKVVNCDYYIILRLYQYEIHDNLFSSLCYIKGRYNNLLRNRAYETRVRNIFTNKIVPFSTFLPFHS